VQLVSKTRCYLSLDNKSAGGVGNLSGGMALRGGEGALYRGSPLLVQLASITCGHKKAAFRRLGVLVVGNLRAQKSRLAAAQWGRV
jgi:hypothetical protein